MRGPPAHLLLVQAAHAVAAAVAGAVDAHAQRVVQRRALVRLDRHVPSYGPCSYGLCSYGLYS